MASAADNFASNLNWVAIGKSTDSRSGPVVHPCPRSWSSAGASPVPASIPRAGRIFAHNAGASRPPRRVRRLDLPPCRCWRSASCRTARPPSSCIPDDGGAVAEGVLKRWRAAQEDQPVQRATVLLIPGHLPSYASGRLERPGLRRRGPSWLYPGLFFRFVTIPRHPVRGTLFRCGSGDRSPRAASATAFSLNIFAGIVAALPNALIRPWSWPHRRAVGAFIIGAGGGRGVCGVGRGFVENAQRRIVVVSIPKRRSVTILWRRWLAPAAQDNTSRA